MRLLKREQTGWWASSYTFSLIDHDPRTSTLPYAILSHIWGADEITYQDIRNGTAKKRVSGYKKLEFCATQAEHDGLMYFWIDTCCIDKSNNAELSEAINSMYRWYQNATKCYVYLSDVSIEEEWATKLQHSKWFTRGWTLQELIAPRVVEFFSTEGAKLGDKASLVVRIQQITGISKEALQGKPLSEIPEQERFSWTARRQTTIEEDAVYCLTGLFDVYVPPIYGEGRNNALARLQREIRFRDNPELYAVKEAAWHVPFERNSRFTGRESQIAELQRKLTINTVTTRIAVIGLGGAGKTQLVLELLYRHKEQHKSCSTMWIAATSMESVEQSYFAIAQQLNIPGCEDDKVDVKKLVQDYLSRDEAGPWLLVYDNADDIDLWTTTSTPAERHLRSSREPQRLIDYLPRHKQGCILFTTRNRRVAATLASANIVTVPAMSEEAAVKLLTVSLADASLVESSQDALQLLAALTYLPLAIAQAAAYINANGSTLIDYLSLLEEKEEDAIDVLSEDFEDYGRYQDIKNPIATTWLISFEQIRRYDTLAADYLSFMACIDFRDIPQSLLPPGPSRKKEMDAIGTLSAYSFVSRRPGSATIDLHRLVHLTTRNWLRKEGILHRWIEKAISRVEGVLPEEGYEHENRAVWRTYLAHAQQVLMPNPASKDGEQRTELMWKYGRCLSSDGRWREVEAIFNEIVMTERRAAIEDSTATLSATLWLALAYREQGRLAEAEQLQAQVLETCKTKLGTDHPHTLSSMHNLASTYSRQGRWAEAGQLQSQVLEMCEAKLGADHPYTLTSMHDLASTYRDQGRWEEAEQLDVQVLETRKTKLGAEHPNTLKSMNSLASTYRKQGRWAEAEQLHVKVLEMQETKLGADHPDTLTSMHNLAVTWKDLDRDAEAVRLMTDCVQRRNYALGIKHPDYRLSYMTLNEWKTESAHPG